MAGYWLKSVSRDIALTLPTGNGTDGPWNLIPLLAPNGCLVIGDICRGVYYMTNAVVPTHVAKFALPVDKTHSPHPAGGTGAGPGYMQIALLIPGTLIPCEVPTGNKIVSGLWGFRNCYSTVDSLEYIQHWHTRFNPNLVVPQWEETTQPQTEEWRAAAAGGVMVPLTIFDEFKAWLQQRHPRWSDYHALLLPLSWVAGGSWVGSVNLGYINVHGLRAEREAAFSWLAGVWPLFAHARAVKAAEESLVLCDALKDPGCYNRPPVGRVTLLWLSDRTQV